METTISIGTQAITKEQAETFVKCISDAINKLITEIKKVIEWVKEKLSELSINLRTFLLDYRYNLILSRYERIAKSKDKAWTVRVFYRIKSVLTRRYYLFKRKRIR